VTLSVVVPVRDGARLVGEAVRALVTEVAAVDGEVVVVDDASADTTAEEAEASGARVLTAGARVGPYAARNLGWAAARHDAIAFVDARCRPRPGWARQLLAPLDDAAVALVAGEVVVRSGPTVAARTAHQLQPLRLAEAASAPFLPYAPTCHLLARRAAIEAVGGFAEVRGGGDVDLCWAVQHAGLGELRPAPEAVLEWVPRETVTALREQYGRYGRNYGRLATAWAPLGCPRPSAPSPWRAGLHELRRPATSGRPPVVALAAAACRASFAAGLRQGLGEHDTALGPDSARPAER